MQLLGESREGETALQISVSWQNLMNVNLSVPSGGGYNNIKPTPGNYWLMLVIKIGFTKPFYSVWPLNFSSTFELYYPKLKVQQSFDFWIFIWPWINILMTNMEMFFPSYLLLMAQGLFNYFVHSSFIFQIFWS